jgi:hypothetical protein
MVDFCASAHMPETCIKKPYGQEKRRKKYDLLSSSRCCEKAFRRRAHWLAISIDVFGRCLLEGTGGWAVRVALVLGASAFFLRVFLVGQH